MESVPGIGPEGLARGLWGRPSSGKRGERRRRRLCDQAEGPRGRRRSWLGLRRVSSGQGLRRVEWAGPPRGREESPGWEWHQQAVWVKTVSWPPEFEPSDDCRGCGRPFECLGGTFGRSGGLASIRGSQRGEVRRSGRARMSAGAMRGRERPKHPCLWSGSAGGGRRARGRLVGAAAFHVADRRGGWGGASAGLAAGGEPAGGLSAESCTRAEGRGSCAATGRRLWRRS